ncbi:MAG: aminotransferase class IV [Spirochaetales bacterium]|nr:aminotransferase class IV [Spirochaetales bacterium]
MSIYYMDGEFIESDKAVLPVNDMAVLRGYAIFDYMRTYRGRPFYLKEHIRRFAHSGDCMGLPLPLSEQEIYDVVMETLSRNSFEESNVRIIYTGGISADSVSPGGNGKFIVMVTERMKLPEWWYTEGVKIITAQVERYMPEAKSTNYMNAVLTQQQAKKAGAVEAVYVDRKGNVHEGTTTNIFLHLDGRWVTPDRDILPGITRSVIIELMESEFTVEPGEVSREDLLRADEIFISASNKEIIPVIQVDEVKIASGRVGDKTRKVMDLFRNYTEAYGRGEISEK